MSIFWKEDFESGTVSSQADQIYRTSSTYGWGNPTGDPDSVVQVVSVPVYKGTRSCQYLYTADPPVGGWRVAGIKKWNGIAEHSEVYFGGAFYIPSTFALRLQPGTGWANIMQMQEVGGLYRYFASILIGKNQGQNPVFAIFTDYAPGSNSQQQLTADRELPLDRWFTAVMYYRGGANGNVKFWLDGVLLLDHNHDFSDSASPGPGCDISVYASDLLAGAYIVVDEITAASTLVLATPTPDVIPPPPPPPEVYTCPFCQLTFTTQADMDAHILAVHGQVPVFTCPTCGEVFSTQALLDAHMLSAHSQVPVYTCPTCGTTFSSQALLDAHIAAVHPTGGGGGIPTTTAINPAMLITILGLLCLAADARKDTQK